MKRYSILLLCFFAFLSNACSCGEENRAEEKNAAPELKSISPEDGYSFTGSKLSIKFSFDQNVKTSSSSISLLSLTPEASIDKLFAYGEDVTVELSALSEETSYTLTIPAGVVKGFKKNQEGAAQIVYTFKTVKDPDVIPPDFDFLAEVKLPDNDAVAFARMLGMGWNLGNQFDATGGSGLDSETSWGNPKATQATFDKLKSYGFKSVRIPVTWQKHMGEAPDYKVDEAWMERVYEVVGYARKAGLIVILNMHHDDSSKGGWFSLLKAVAGEDYKTAMKAQYTALWKQIAERFKNEGDYLILEAFNEPHAGDNWASDDIRYHNLLNEVLQLFVDIVRESGGSNATRWLGIPCYSSNPNYALKYLVLPKDSANGRLAVTFHCYDPYHYCLAPQDIPYGRSKWGHTSGSQTDERDFVILYYKLKTKFIDNNIPLYAGETGCVNRGNAIERAFQQYYLEFTWKTAKEYGIAPFLWDNGIAGFGNETHGFVHHGTGEYVSYKAADGTTFSSAETLSRMNKAVNISIPSYTLESIYNSAP